MRITLPALAVTVALAVSAGCAPRDVREFWAPGARYELQLRVLGVPALTVERAQYLAPVSDTVTLRLVVDSVARDSAYGRFDAETRHFPVMFRAVEGDRFVATRVREHWLLVLNPHATDTGLLLDGERAHGQIAGDWTTRYSSPSRGHFALSPAT